MSEKYILDADGKPVLCEDLMTWSKWFETADRNIAKTEIGDVSISTVFLGLNHSFNDGPPIVFETMVFGGEHDGEMQRYVTKEQALAGHDKMVQMCN